VPSNPEGGFGQGSNGRAEGDGGGRAYWGLVGAGEASEEGLVWEERAGGNGGVSNDIGTVLLMVMFYGSEGKVGEPKLRVLMLK